MLIMKWLSNFESFWTTAARAILDQNLVHKYSWCEDTDSGLNDLQKTNRALDEEVEPLNKKMETLEDMKKDLWSKVN